MAFSLRRMVIGRPVATEHADHQKLTKLIALPVFASDALSSVAYASEEIMAALLVAGTANFGLTPWLSLGIVILLAIVTTSYRQTVMAYPSGGGAYIVAHENLGDLAAMAAGAALLIDYILTVSVSVAAGVAAIASLLQNSGHMLSQTEVVWMCIAAVLFIAVLNLRGLKESGAVFAVPTYAFVSMMYVVLGVGFYKLVTGTLIPVHTAQEFAQAGALRENHLVNGEAVTLFLLLHAFASGCTALTGVEAISNGVPAFREPASKNAATTMLWMASILGSVFLGLSFLATHINALPSIAGLPGAKDALGETVISQVGRSVFDTAHSPTGKIFYSILQIATALILVLAANTSFADFPRLSALMARDGFLPRQFANIGDKLVFDRGIIVLALFSIVLIGVFRGSVDALIPLYAIGVFLSFTLSQAGMVQRWRRLKERGWQMRAGVNGFGAFCTFVVMIVFGMVKFKDGAYVVIILIPLLIALFGRIQAHYRSVRRQLSMDGYRPTQGVRNHVLLLVPDIHRGIIPAMQLARSMSSEARAVHVSIDPTREARVRQRWMLYSRGMPLTVLPSPYRTLVEPIVTHVQQLRTRDPQSLVIVVIPEFEPTGWFPKLLHGRAGLALAVRLHFIPGVVVVNVPYHIVSFMSEKEEVAARNDIGLQVGGEPTGNLASYVSARNGTPE